MSIPSLSLESGKKYVVTGGNGSGKSSFLLLLNLLLNSFDDKSFLNVSGSISYPTKDMAIVTQQHYCPMETDLFSWLTYFSVSVRGENNSPADYDQKILSLLGDLKFSPKNLTALTEEFHSVKKNWCAELSGGQIKKVQMMQMVFIPETCPKILLLDETMGPLDPESKKILQEKLIEHCPDSLILAVYHYDNVKDCVSAEFFDSNIHFEDGTASVRELCGGNTTAEGV